MAAIRQKTNFIKHDDLPIHNKQLHSLGTGSNTLLMNSMLASGSARTVTMRTMRWMETRFVNWEGSHGKGEGKHTMDDVCHDDSIQRRCQRHVITILRGKKTRVDRAWPCLTVQPSPANRNNWRIFFRFHGGWSAFWYRNLLAANLMVADLFQCNPWPTASSSSGQIFGNQKMNYPHLVPLAEFPYLQPKFLAYVISRHVSS